MVRTVGVAYRHGGRGGRAHTATTKLTARLRGGGNGSGGWRQGVAAAAAAAVLAADYAGEACAEASMTAVYVRDAACGAAATGCNATAAAAVSFIV